jgi:hypothetical protein
VAHARPEAVVTRRVRGSRRARTRHRLPPRTQPRHHEPRRPRASLARRTNVVRNTTIIRSKYLREEHGHLRACPHAVGHAASGAGRGPPLQQAGRSQLAHLATSRRGRGGSTRTGSRGRGVCGADREGAPGSWQPLARGLEEARLAGDVEPTQLLDGLARELGHGLGRVAQEDQSGRVRTRSTSMTNHRPWSRTVTSPSPGFDGSSASAAPTTPAPI